MISSMRSRITTSSRSGTPLEGPTAKAGTTIAQIARVLILGRVPTPLKKAIAGRLIQLGRGLVGIGSGLVAVRRRLVSIGKCLIALREPLVVAQGPRSRGAALLPWHEVPVWGLRKTIARQSVGHDGPPDG
jgi:hypothetical protein